jgi:hypothetical protein
MTGINWLRVILGGVVWCLAYNLLLGASWFTLLHSRGIASFHPLLGAQQPPTPGQAVSVVLLTLAMGIFATWFYAAMQPRYAAGPLTAACIGVALWAIWGLMPNWPPAVMQSLPAGPLVVELACKLVVIALATLAGASLYREKTVAP